MKILSFVIAVLIWLLVTYINDPVITRRFSDVEVTVLNSEELEKKGYTYDIIKGETVSFTVKGNRYLVNSLTVADFEVTADLKNLSIMDAVPIEVEARHDNNRLEITKSEDTMIISKDKGVTVSIPVNAQEKGTPQKGYALGSLVATPNLIKVKGPKSLLIEAKEIRVMIDISNATEDVTTIDRPKLYDEDGALITSKQIEFDTSEIKVDAQIWKTKDVNITLEAEGNPTEGYKMTSFDYEPKKITVAAEDEILETLQAINLGAVSVEGLSKDYEKDIPVEELNLPDGVVATRDVSAIKVKAVIEEKKNIEKNFLEKDIDIRNNKNKYKVTFSKDNKYTVNLFGAKSEIDALDAKVLDPWVDVSGLEPGTHNVVLHVKEPDDITVENTSTVTVTLKE